MANVTKIKAKDSDISPKQHNKPKKVKKSAEVEKTEKTKKPFILFRPFIALGKYLYASWKELRQVRWPNRSTTWKMVLAIFIYTLVFSAFLVALDVLFDFIFSKILA